MMLPQTVPRPSVGMPVLKHGRPFSVECLEGACSSGRCPGVGQKRDLPVHPGGSSLLRWTLHNLVSAVMAPFALFLPLYLFLEQE
jgi:hypothetical protein